MQRLASRTGSAPETSTLRRSAQRSGPGASTRSPGEDEAGHPRSTDGRRMSTEAALSPAVQSGGHCSSPQRVPGLQGLSKQDAWVGAAEETSSGPGDLLVLPGGMFLIGSEEHRYPEDGESPSRPVDVGGFRIAANTVRKDDFARFTAATAYATTAEARGVVLRHGYGVYNATGNVWEGTADRFGPQPDRRAGDPRWLLSVPPLLLLALPVRRLFGQYAGQQRRDHRLPAGRGLPLTA
jgi:formylglycine-generating enzyme required for sulfatase activity